MGLPPAPDAALVVIELIMDVLLRLLRWYGDTDVMVWPVTPGRGLLVLLMPLPTSAPLVAKERGPVQVYIYDKELLKIRAIETRNDMSRDMITSAVMYTEITCRLCFNLYSE